MVNVTTYLKETGIKGTFENTFRNVIEEHIDFLRDVKNSIVINVEPHLVYKYENNLYGLLSELKYDIKYHWAIMRANYFHNPNEINREVRTLIIPKVTFIDNLLKIYNSASDNI